MANSPDLLKAKYLQKKATLDAKYGIKPVVNNRHDSVDMLSNEEQANLTYGEKTIAQLEAIREADANPTIGDKFGDLSVATMSGAAGALNNFGQVAGTLNAAMMTPVDWVVSKINGSQPQTFSDMLSARTDALHNVTDPISKSAQKEYSYVHQAALAEKAEIDNSDLPEETKMLATLDWYKNNLGATGIMTAENLTRQLIETAAYSRFLPASMSTKAKVFATTMPQEFAGFVDENRQKGGELDAQALRLGLGVSAGNAFVEMLGGGKKMDMESIMHGGRKYAGTGLDFIKANLAEMGTEVIQGTSTRMATNINNDIEATHNQGPGMVDDMVMGSTNHAAMTAPFITSKTALAVGNSELAGKLDEAIKDKVDPYNFKSHADPTNEKYDPVRAYNKSVNSTDKAMNSQADDVIVKASNHLSELKEKVKGAQTDEEKAVAATELIQFTKAYWLPLLDAQSAHQKSQDSVNPIYNGDEFVKATQDLMTGDLTREPSQTIGDVIVQGKQTAFANSTGTPSSANIGQLGRVAIIGKDAKINSNFGMRTHPITGEKKGHNGIDINAPEGTSIYAPTDAKVIDVSENATGGKQVRIQLADGHILGFAHLSASNVSVGDVVRANTVIAVSGNTGKSTGAHIHFTVRNPKGEYVNPETYQIGSVSAKPAAPAQGDPRTWVTNGQPSGKTYQTISNSKGNGFDNNKDMITESAQAVGIDPRYLFAMGGPESGFVTNADNPLPGQSASGLFQFIDSTWNSMKAKYGQRYGIPANASQHDPKANAILGALYVKEHIENIRKNDREVTPTDVYMNHFLGHGGYNKFVKALDANPNAPVSTFMSSKQINDNDKYTKNKDGSVKTVQQMYGTLTSTINSHAGTSGATTATPAPTQAEDSQEGTSFLDRWRKRNAEEESQQAQAEIPTTETQTESADKATDEQKQVAKEAEDNIQILDENHINQLEQIGAITPESAAELKRIKGIKQAVQQNSQLTDMKSVISQPIASVQYEDTAQAAEPTTKRKPIVIQAQAENPNSPVKSSLGILAQLDHLERSGILTTEEANNLRMLSDVNQQHAATRNIKTTNSDIMTGFKGANNESSFMGVLQYNQQLVPAIENDDTETVSALMRTLSNFTEGHRSKANAINEAVSYQRTDSKADVWVVPQVTKNSNGDSRVEWVVKEGKPTKEERSKFAKAGAISLPGARKLQNMVNNEADILDNLVSGYSNHIADLQRQGKLSSNNTGNKTPIAPTPVPTGSTTITAPNTDRIVTINDSNMEAPKDGIWVGRSLGRNDANGKPLRYNLADTASKAVQGGANLVAGTTGWLSNPFSMNAKKGFKTKNQTESVNKYVELFNRTFNANDEFAQNILNQRGQRIYTDSIHQNEATFLDHVINNMPEAASKDIAKAREWLGSQAVKIQTDSKGKIKAITFEPTTAIPTNIGPTPESLLADGYTENTKQGSQSRSFTKTDGDTTSNIAFGASGTLHEQTITKTKDGVRKVRKVDGEVTSDTTTKVIENTIKDENGVPLTYRVVRDTATGKIVEVRTAMTAHPNHLDERGKYNTDKDLGVMDDAALDKFLQEQYNSFSIESKDTTAEYQAELAKITGKSQDTTIITNPDNSDQFHSIPTKLVDTINRAADVLEELKKVRSYNSDETKVAQQITLLEQMVKENPNVDIVFLHKDTVLAKQAKDLLGDPISEVSGFCSTNHTTGLSTIYLNTINVEGSDTFKGSDILTTLVHEYTHANTQPALKLWIDDYTANEATLHLGLEALAVAAQNIKTDFQNIRDEQEAKGNAYFVHYWDYMLQLPDVTEVMSVALSEPQIIDVLSKAVLSKDTIDYFTNLGIGLDTTNAHALLSSIYSYTYQQAKDNNLLIKDADYANHTQSSYKYEGPSKDNGASDGNKTSDTGSDGQNTSDSEGQTEKLVVKDDSIVIEEISEPVKPTELFSTVSEYDFNTTQLDPNSIYVVENTSKAKDESNVISLTDTGLTLHTVDTQGVLKTPNTLENIPVNELTPTQLMHKRNRETADIQDMTNTIQNLLFLDEPMATTLEKLHALYPGFPTLKLRNIVEAVKVTTQESMSDYLARNAQEVDDLMGLLDRVQDNLALVEEVKAIITERVKAIKEQSADKNVVFVVNAAGQFASSLKDSSPDLYKWVRNLINKELKFDIDSKTNTQIRATQSDAVPERMGVRHIEEAPVIQGPEQITELGNNEVPATMLDTPIGVFDFIKNLSKVSTKLTDNQNKVLLAIVKSVANYMPDVKVVIQSNQKGMSRYDAQTKTIHIVPQGFASIHELFARLLVQASNAWLAENIADLSLDDKPELHKLNHEINGIRSELSALVDTMDNEGTLPENVKGVIYYALASNSNLLSVGLTNPVLMQFLQNTRSGVKVSKPTSIFKRIAKSVATFFGLSKDEETSSFYERLLQASSQATEIQNKGTKQSFKTSKEAIVGALRGITDEDIAAEREKPLKKQNKFILSFQQRQKNTLARIPALAKLLRTNREQALSNLYEGEVSAIQSRQLDDFLAFKEEFTTHLVASFRNRTPSEEAELRRDDLKGFMVEDQNGNLTVDDNVITALSLAAYGWVLEKSHKDRNTLDDIKIMLNLDDSVSDMTVASKIDDYQFIGASLNNVINGLGKNFLSTLNITGREDASIYAEAQLAMSVGNWIISAMQMAGLVHIHSMPTATHMQNIIDVGGTNPFETTPGPHVQSYFVSVTDREGGNKNPRLAQISELSKGTKGFLSDLFGVQVGLRMPSMTAPKEVNLKIKRSKATVSQFQEEGLKVMQMGEYKINEDMFDLINDLYQSDSDFLLDLLDARVTQEELNRLHITERKGKENSSEGNLRDLLNAFDWIAGLERSDDTGFQVFYDSVDTARNSRMHQRSNMFNMQGSTLHRAMANYSSDEIEIDTTSLDINNVLDENGKPTIATLFLRGIAENAEGTKKIMQAMIDPNKEVFEEFTVDKMSSPVFIPAFFEYLMTDADVLAATSAMINLRAGMKLTTEDKAVIAKVVGLWDMKGQSIRALLEWSKFYEAYSEGLPLKTSLTLGSDGVNNGTAISAPQNGVVTSSEFLYQVGVIPEVPSQPEYADINNYFDVRQFKSIGDYYTGFKNMLNAALTTEFKLNDDHVRAIQALNPSLLERKTAKDALVPYGYTAGMSRIKQVVFERFLSDIKEQMVKFAHMTDEEIANKANEYYAFQENIAYLLNQDVNDLGMPSIEDRQKLLTAWFAPGELKQLEVVYNLNIGQVIADTMVQYTGELTNRREQLISMHNATLEIFIAARNTLIEQAENTVIERHGKEKFDTEYMTKQEWDELVESQLEPVRAMIANAFSFRDPEDERRSDTDLFEITKELSSDNGKISGRTRETTYDDFNQVTYVDNRSRGLPFEVSNVESAGLFPASALVQSADAFIALLATTIDNIVSLNVHDSGSAALTHYFKMVDAQNKGYYQVLSEFHVHLESMKSLVRVISGFYTIKEAGLISEDLFNEIMADKVMKSLYKNDAKLEAMFNDRASFSTMIAYMIERAQKIENEKFNILAGMKVVHQYAGEGGEHVVTAEEKVHAEDQRALVTETFQELLNNVTEMFGEAALVKARSTNKVMGKARPTQQDWVFMRDQQRSLKSDKIIAFGKKGSEPKVYAEYWGNDANTSSYKTGEVVSVFMMGGDEASRYGIDSKNLAEQLALATNAKVIFLLNESSSRNFVNQKGQQWSFEEARLANRLVGLYGYIELNYKNHKGEVTGSGVFVPNGSNYSYEFLNHLVPSTRVAVPVYQSTVEDSNTINIWSTVDNGYNTLSNLAPSTFSYQGKEYVSVEHAYQSLKSGEFDENTYKQERWKKGWQKISGIDSGAIDEAKRDLMHDLLVASFTQDLVRQQLLLSTGNKELTHQRPDRSEDPWEKVFPEILMKVRSEIRAENQNKDTKPTTMEEITNHSGGANGADISWDQIGQTHGVVNHMHYFLGTRNNNNAPHGNTPVLEKDVDEGKVTAARAGNQLYGINNRAMSDTRLIRNWSQVKYSDSVFAVSRLGLKGELWRSDMDLKTGKPNKANPRYLAKDTVQGGTGYAVEMAIMLGKPVYVYNMEANSKYPEGWYTYEDGKWLTMTTTPTLTKNFAGIGSRELTENGLRAIDNVYQATKQNLKPKYKLKAPHYATKLTEITFLGMPTKGHKITFAEYPEAEIYLVKDGSNIIAVFPSVDKALNLQVGTFTDARERIVILLNYGANSSAKSLATLQSVGLFTDEVLPTTPTALTAEDIYNQLGNKTESEHVVIKPVYQRAGVAYAKSIGGVFSMRVNDMKMHFGNPYSHVPKEIAKGLIATKDTKESVVKYIDWVINSSDERAAWVREQLKSGVLKGRKIVYYQALKDKNGNPEPSHATALDYLINKYDWNDNTSIAKSKVPFKIEVTPDIARSSAPSTQAVNNMSAMDVLHQLDKGNISNEHNELLDSMIDNIIGDFYQHTPNGKQKVDKTIATIKSKAVVAGFNLSDKEAAVNEVLLAVFSAHINSHSGESVINEYRKMYNEITDKDAKNKLTVEDLNPNYKNLTKAQQKIIQSQLAYLTSATKGNKQGEFLPRFLALTIASQDFYNVMNKTRERVRKQPKTIAEKMISFVQKVVDWLVGAMLRNSTKDTVSEQIVNLVDTLRRIDINSRNSTQSKLRDTWYSSQTYTKKLNDMVNKGFRGAAKLAGKISTNPTFKDAAHLAEVVTASDADVVGKATFIAQQRVFNQNGRLTEFGELINDILAQTNLQNVVEKLLRLTQLAGKYRDEAKVATIKLLKQGFTRDLSKSERAAITNALARTDMSALLEYMNISQVMSLIGNKSAREKMVAKLETEILQGVNGKDVLFQTKALAAYMALGETPENLLKNVDSIASHFGTKFRTKTVDPVLRQKVDILASLYAYEYASPQDKEIVESLAKDETNGVKLILRTHKTLADEAKKDFIGNMYNYEKGYLPEINDPYKSIKYAESWQEVEDLKGKGWILLTPQELDQDSSDLTSSRVMMYHPNFDYVDYRSGAVDLKDTHSRGTVVYTTKDNFLDVNRVANDMVARRNLRNQGKFEDYDPTKSSGSLIVTYNADGTIKNYHYEMTGDVRNRLLNRNNDIFDLLGALHASNVYKPMVRAQQRKAAEILEQDYTENKKAHAADYIWLDPESEDPKIVEQWRMLPHPFRERAAELFGRGKPIPVRNLVYNSMFGYRVYSLAEMFDKVSGERNLLERFIVGLFTMGKEKNHYKARNTIRNVEQVIQYVMKNIKETIVLRGYKVLMGNMIANTLLLTLHGVYPADIIKGYRMAWFEGRKFTQYSARLAEIKLELQANAKDKNKVRDLNRELMQINDALEKSPMLKYMKAGLMSTIVEDVGLSKENTIYQNKFEDTVDEVLDKIPEPIVNTLKFIAMARGTALYEFMADATQYSDFGAKFILAKHLQERKGMSFDKAITEAQKNFINFDIPLGRGIDYLNTIGLLMFTKFAIRFQKVIFERFKKQPATLIMQTMLMEGLLNQPSVPDPSMLNGFPENPFSPSVLTVFGMQDDLMTTDAIMGTFNVMT